MQFILLVTILFGLFECFYAKNLVFKNEKFYAANYGLMLGVFVADIFLISRDKLSFGIFILYILIILILIASCYLLDLFLPKPIISIIECLPAFILMLLISSLIIFSFNSEKPKLWFLLLPGAAYVASVILQKDKAKLINNSLVASALVLLKVSQGLGTHPFVLLLFSVFFC